MAALIPAGDPKSVELVGRKKASFGDEVATNITYEYEYPNQWLLINVATRKTASGVTISGFGVQPLAQSLEELNRFRLSGKSSLQYLYWRWPCHPARMPLRSGLVRAYAVQGPQMAVGAFHSVWFRQVCRELDHRSVEHYAVIPAAFGGCASAPLYGPWTIGVSIPLGNPAPHAEK